MDVPFVRFDTKAPVQECVLTATSGHLNLIGKAPKQTLAFYAADQPIA
jgi:hypothetical protein